MRISPEPKERHRWGAASTPFEELGGGERVEALANAFYDKVEESSPTLSSMLPADTTRSRHKLALFLTGWMGGPPLYWEERGHPRLRMRHAPFAIDDFAADEWMRCMAAALEDVGAPPDLHAFLVEELGNAARHLRNHE